MADGRSFCPKCEVLKVTRQHFTNLPSSLLRRMHQLGSPTEVISRRTECVLCAAIALAFEGGPTSYRKEGIGNVGGGGGGEELKGIREVERPGRVQVMWFLLENPTRAARAVEDEGIEEGEGEGEGQGPGVLIVHYVAWDEGVKIPLVIRPLSRPEAPTPYFATRIQDSQIDPAMVRGWLRTCEEQHTCKQLFATPYRTPSAFRLIDVDEIRVVKIQTQCRYLSLSYVWGSGQKFCALRGNIDEISRPGGLEMHREDLSPTIRDAILFTKMIGERYLWVDSLCIVQDGDDKAETIRDMDLVYSQAVMMISAAADYCLTEGLVGVSRPRSTREFIVRVGEDLAIAAQFDFSSYVDHSVYNTRGWVYGIPFDGYCYKTSMADWYTADIKNSR
jgi:hypothetical protein